MGDRYIMMNLSVVKRTGETGLEVTYTVTSSGGYPSKVFIHENLGTDVLGDYQGVCNVADMARYSEWSGTAVPKFGNRFVRFNQAKIVLSFDMDLDLITNTIKNRLKELKRDFEQSGVREEIYEI